MRHVFASVAIAAALVLGGTSAATAVECPSGTIMGTPASFKKVKEIKIEDGDCLVRYVIVRNGNVQVTEAGNVRIRDTIVRNGDVQMEKSDRAVVRDTTLRNGSIQVKENGVARVDDNVVQNGDIQVEKNDIARVRDNTASGNIQCVDNGTLVSSGNAAGGDLECP